MEIRHKETGHKGKITGELNSFNPPQWGIFWFGGSHGKEHAKRIKEKGLQYYWNDKDKIEIL